MPENNQMMSVEGQLVGMPLAGPESFSQQQLDYLKRALGVDETVLYESSTASDSFTTSEPIENFEEIKVILKGSDVSGVDIKSISNVIVTSSYSSSIGFTFLSTYGLSGNVVLNWAAYYNRSSNTFTKASCLYEGASGGAQSAGTNNNVGGVYKVIGIHRIAGGNT